VGHSLETQVRSSELHGELAPLPAVFVQPIDCRHAERVTQIAALSFPAVWSEKEFCYFLAHENRICLGSFTSFEGKDRLRAYFLGLLVQGDLDIISIATHPDDRRLGLGSTLLSHVCHLPSVQRAFLEVETSNEAAAALYSKHGFQTLGRRHSYYGPGRDAFLMRWCRQVS
jgi:[ribosomal protein S18]-alanine N-acetyltransferase